MTFLQVVDVLLSNGAFVFETNSLGQTPLHLASSFGHGEVIKALVKAGANVKVGQRRDRNNQVQKKPCAGNPHLCIYGPNLKLL